MDKRHQNALTSRLEDALLNGCSHVTWSELYRWYGVQKLAARTWRDLQTRWEDVSESESRLMRIEGRGGIFIYDENQCQPIYPDSSTDE